MFWFRKKKKSEPKIENKETTVKSVNDNRVSLTKDIINQDEKALVSLITSSIAANDNPYSKFEIKSIQEIDVEKEEAIAIVSAVLANDKPLSKFRCVSINEINEGEQLC